MVNYSEILRLNVERCLKKEGLSQRELAKRMGDHPVMIGRWLRGTGNPTLAKLGLISEALGVPLSSLLAGQEETASDSHHKYEDCLEYLSEVLHSAEKQVKSRRRRLAAT